MIKNETKYFKRKDGEPFEIEVVSRVTIVEEKETTTLITSGFIPEGSKEIKEAEYKKLIEPKEVEIDDMSKKWIKYYNDIKAKAEKSFPKITLEENYALNNVGALFSMWKKENG